MKRFAATAITLMMTAAIGTAAASPYDHDDNRQAAGYAHERGNNRGASDRGQVRYDNRTAYRNDAAHRNDANGRWNGRDGDRRWNGYYGYRGGYEGRWNGGYRYGPRYVSVVVGGAPYYAPAYYGPAYYAPAYGYDEGYAYEGGYAQNGGPACAPGSAYAVPVQRDNTGARLLGAVIGGALGNTIGKGNGRTAATVAGAAVGYGVAASATDNRGYEMACGG